MVSKQQNVYSILGKKRQQNTEFCSTDGLNYGIFTAWMPLISAFIDAFQNAIWSSIYAIIYSTPSDKDGVKNWAFSIIKISPSKMP